MSLNSDILCAKLFKHSSKSRIRQSTNETRLRHDRIVKSEFLCSDNIKMQARAQPKPTASKKTKIKSKTHGLVLTLDLPETFYGSFNWTTNIILITFYIIQLNTVNQHCVINTYPVNKKTVGLSLFWCHCFLLTITNVVQIVHHYKFQKWSAYISGKTATTP